MIARNSKHKFERKFGLRRMFRHLDRLQDIVVFGLSLVLVIEMLFTLGGIFVDLWVNSDSKTFTSHAVFLLILVELFRLLSVYLDSHRISVRVAVEIAVVSILRRLVVEGVLHSQWLQVLAVCSLLFALGGLMWISYQIDGKGKLNH